MSVILRTAKLLTEGAECDAKPSQYIPIDLMLMVFYQSYAFKVYQPVALLHDPAIVEG